MNVGKGVPESWVYSSAPTFMRKALWTLITYGPWMGVGDRDSDNL